MDFLDGKVKLEFLGHAGILVRIGSKKIAIDPFNVSNNISDVDIILITHRHYDHCSIKDVQKIIKPGSVVISPVDCQSKLLKIEGIDLQTVEWGDVLDFGNLKIEAFPAYNVKSDHHSRSDGWLGYLIKSQNIVFYHSGDTDYIPEMQKLSGYGKHGNEFIVLLPVAGDVVMDYEEAAEAASVISPNLAIPISYGAGVYGTLKDAENFIEACKDKNIKAEILEKI